MTPQELQELLRDDAAAEAVQFVDVREPGEADLAALPRFRLFPLSQASRRARARGGRARGGGRRRAARRTGAVGGCALFTPPQRRPSWADTIADDLDIAKPTVVLCHHGVRRARACARGGARRTPCTLGGPLPPVPAGGAASAPAAAAALGARCPNAHARARAATPPPPPPSPAGRCR